MKKFKKVFAVILSLAMVLGMSMTSFAEVVANGNITVTNLANEKTTVSIYEVVSSDTNGNNWVIADWAKSIVKTEEQNEDEEIVKLNPYQIDAAALKTVVVANNIAATASKNNFEGDTVNGTTVTFDSNLKAGVYLVIAESKATPASNVTYLPMLAVTYNRDALADNTAANTLEAVATTISAKFENIPFDKKAKDGDKYVAVGTSVGFEINTTFPSFHDNDGKNTQGTYKITDTATNLNIDSTSVEVYVNNQKLSSESDYTFTVVPNRNNSSLEIVFDSERFIGTSNTHGGQSVYVTYNATVMAQDGGISNTAQAIIDEGTPISDTETLYTGTVTMTKTVEGSNQPLEGAEFKVYYVKDSKTYYAKATNGKVTDWTENEADGTKFVTDQDGKFTVSGLDADVDYRFKEVKAPAGYSINENDAHTTWTPLGQNDQARDRAGNATMGDTRLSALPSTGGIGTTIFTIGGCAIMIIAAALFFASRRRAAK